MEQGKIAYRFATPAYPANILYVNIIPRYSCVNDCLFCSRPRREDDICKPNIYERKAGSFLYLPESPSIDEIMEAVGSEMRPDDQELAIIGLGEPLMQLPKVVEIMRRVKEKRSIKTRVDTNGLVKCMYDEPAKKLEEAGLDEIRISLNAVSEEEYVRLCRPRFHDAFQNLVSFIQDCISSSIDTYVSFVVGFEDEGIRERTAQELIGFASSLGVKPGNVILRQYVKPLA